MHASFYKQLGISLINSSLAKISIKYKKIYELHIKLALLLYDILKIHIIAPVYRLSKVTIF